MPNGKKLITLVSKLPIIDEHQQVLGLVGYFTDITALKQKERALKRAKCQAEAANRAKSIFIANISHDLRTPLTGLLGMAKIVHEEVQTLEGKTAAANLFQAAQVLLNLINGIIAFSQWESGHLRVQTTAFDLTATINGIVSLLKPSAQEKNLNFNISLSKQLPQKVIGDSVRLQPILLNLLSNAIKFTHQGTIDLKVKIIPKLQGTQNPETPGHSS